MCPIYSWDKVRSFRQQSPNLTSPDWDQSRCNDFVYSTGSGGESVPRNTGIHPSVTFLLLGELFMVWFGDVLLWPFLNSWTFYIVILGHFMQFFYNPVLWSFLRSCYSVIFYDRFIWTFCTTAIYIFLNSVIQSLFMTVLYSFF